MKILLIYPYFLNDRVYTIEDVRAVPLGVYYVAAVLKQNRYDVEILNWHNINTTPHLIRKILAEKKPDIIGFSILNANRWGGVEIARIARQINPGVKIVFGGIGATYLWEHFLTHFQEVDFVVIGEGEHTFLRLIRCLEANKSQAIEKVKGVAFRKNGKPVRTAAVEPVGRLDDLPNPAQYFKYQHLTLTRGCGGNCNFCGSPRFWGRQVRFHSADYFVDQLECLSQKGIQFFYFSDDTFTAHKRRAIEVCRKIIEKKTGYYLECHITGGSCQRTSTVLDEKSRLYPNQLRRRKRFAENKKIFIQKYFIRKNPLCFHLNPKVRHHGPGLFYLRCSRGKPADHPGND